MDRTLALIGRAHQGDKTARDILFEENTGLIYSVARRFLGRGVEMDFSQFPLLGIWSAQNDGPYVCLEPWAGRCDDEGFCEDISKKPGINQAKPGECWKKQYAILIG